MRVFVVRVRYFASDEGMRPLPLISVNEKAPVRRVFLFGYAPFLAGAGRPGSGDNRGEVAGHLAGEKEQGMTDDTVVQMLTRPGTRSGQLLRAPARLERPAIAALAGAGRLCELSPGEPLGGETGGDRPDGLLLRGILRHQREGCAGERQILNLILPGEVLRAEAADRPGHVLVAATRATFLAVPPARFGQLVHDFPCLHSASRRSMQAQMERFRVLTWAILALGPEARICAFLDLASRMLPIEPLPRGGHVLTLPLPWKDIADMLAVPVETVARTLYALERVCAIRLHGGGRLEVADPADLRRRAAPMGDD